jgi:hypothetical protein
MRKRPFGTAASVDGPRNAASSRSTVVDEARHVLHAVRDDHGSLPPLPRRIAAAH